jgi:hypothetical protein
MVWPNNSPHLTRGTDAPLAVALKGPGTNYSGSTSEESSMTQQLHDVATIAQDIVVTTGLFESLMSGQLVVCGRNPVDCVRCAVD